MQQFSRCLCGLFAALLIALACGAWTHGRNTSNPVFAWYEPPFGIYGTTVAAYTHEIQQAQAAGIDGFALDMFCWIPGDTCTTNGLDYRTLAANMFQAAQNLNTNFKLFFVEDCAEVGGCAASGGGMLTAFGDHPNYYHIQGKPVISAFNESLNTASGSADNIFFTSWLNGITTAGFAPYFIPFFSLGSFVANDPTTTAANYAAGYAPWVAGMVQGLAAFGGFIPTLYAQNNAGYQTVANNNSIGSIASVGSWFGILRLLAAGQQSEFLEFNGGEGLASIWASIMASPPTIVMVESWNDYTESYMNPPLASDFTNTSVPANDSWNITFDYLNTGSHGAYTELNKYYISWYKHGTPPSWPDALYVFYRNGAQSIVPSVTTATMLWNPQGNATLDDIYVTTICKTACTLEVNTGGNITDTPVAAGVVHTRIAFTSGATQTFKIIRNAATLISLTGTTIVTAETNFYNVNPNTYNGYSP